MDINVNLKITADEKVMGALAWVASLADEQGVKKGMVPAPEASKKPEPRELQEAEEPVEPTVSLEEIRSYCIEIVRKDKTKQAGIKALLDKYDSPKIPDLPQEHWQEFWEAVQAL